MLIFFAVIRTTLARFTAAKRNCFEIFTVEAYAVWLFYPALFFINTLHVCLLELLFSKNAVIIKMLYTYAAFGIAVPKRLFFLRKNYHCVVFNKFRKFIFKIFLYSLNCFIFPCTPVSFK